MTKKIKLLILFLFLLLSASVAFNIFCIIKHKKDIFQVAYRYIQPWQGRLNVDADDETGQPILYYQPVREKLEIQYAGYIQEKKLGIYVQDINTGSWLGLNEKEGFLPASLLKVPLAMAVLKKVERGKLILSQELVVNQDDVDGLAGSDKSLTANSNTSLKEVIELALRDSNNTAKNILKRQLSDLELDEIFTHVGMPNPYAQTNEPLIAPRHYARVLKALYMSTFLKPEDSEFILDALNDTKREDLLAAGVPWQVTVIHKYGEREDMLHDCAIVYHVFNPYFICVMTKEIALPEAREIMKDISGQVYNFVNEASQK